MASRGGFLTVNQVGLGLVSSKLGRVKAAIPVETRAAMHRVVFGVQVDVVRNGLTGAKGSDPFWGVTGASGNTLGARTGHTRRSVVARVLDVGRGVMGIVGSPLRQMKLHELGGTITGKPWLRIPTRASQTAAGVDRLAGVSARTIAGGFIFRSKAANLWIAARQGANLVLLYLLRRSVTLRARHIFRDSLRRMTPFIRAEFKSAVGRIVSS